MSYEEKMRGLLSNSVRQVNISVFSDLLNNAIKSVEQKQRL